MSKWVNTRFGNKCLLDKKERAMRVVEEAIELAQSVGVTMLEVDVISEHVFSRPVGEVAQEHAGVMVSLLASCTANQLLLEEVTETEIDRIWAVPLETILAKQAMKNRQGITKYYQGDRKILLAEGKSNCHGADLYWGPYAETPLCVDCHKSS